MFRDQSIYCACPLGLSEDLFSDVADDHSSGGGLGAEGPVRVSAAEIHSEGDNSSLSDGPTVWRGESGQSEAATG